MRLFRKNKVKAGEEHRAFPFEEAPDTAVFTCCHVLSGAEPIRYVSHDEDDGAWQFLCGGDHEESDARIVSLQSIWNMDPAIGALAGMPLGSHACRDDAADSWCVR